MSEPRLKMEENKVNQDNERDFVKVYEECNEECQYV